jgi:Na+/H+ antiporter NhaD/arsenite permease-like protein
VTAAVASLIALFAAIGLSMFSRLNVGLIAIACAWLIGVYLADMRPEAVLGGFPSGLFLTLTGVTLLFAVAQVNHTFEALSQRAIRLVGSNAHLMPLMFFALAFAFSAVGPGAVPGVALVVPLAMVVGARVNLPPMLTALMVANGANAGNLSPISAVGIIANSRMASVDLVGHEWQLMLANLLAHALVAAIAYLFYFFRLREPAGGTGTVPEPSPTQVAPLTPAQLKTLVVLLLWLIGVVGFGLNVGLSAFAAALLLMVFRAVDESNAMRNVPWGIILMVTGMATLIAILESQGGMELFTRLLAAIAGPDSINGVIAFVTGVISTYSSTSGVVLPAFLPTVPGLVERLGGGDPVAIAISITVGSHLVDVSPLSTIGALCVSAVLDPALSRRVFYQLLVWGFSMTVVGALFCQLFAGMLARF